MIVSSHLCLKGIIGRDIFEGHRSGVRCSRNGISGIAVFLGLFFHLVSNNEHFLMTEFPLFVVWGSAPICPVCSGICSSDYSCSYRFFVLCGCLSKRLISRRHFK